MSASDDPFADFYHQSVIPSPSRETFGERLRRRREASDEGIVAPDVSPWQSRVRVLSMIVVGSPHHRAGITRRNSAEAKRVAGVEAILFADDLPAFRNSLGPDFSGEPLLAESEVYYQGQPVAIIVGQDEKSCREAAALLEIDYLPEPPILNLDHAIARESFHELPRLSERGDVLSVLTSAPQTLSGSFLVPPQQPLHPGVTEILVTPEDGGSRFTVKAPSLSPTRIRAAVARAAGVSESDIRIDPSPIAGVTDALEWEPARLAMLVTRAAITCGSPVALRLRENDSSLIRGQRHPVKASFDVAFDSNGRVRGLDLRLYLDAGYYPADSAAVLDRATLHADSVYAIPHLRIRSCLCRTHRITSSSLPAEGAAQGAWVMEEIMRRIAWETKQAAHLVRERNFYQENGELKTVPCGQPILATAIHRAWQQVLRLGQYGQKIDTLRKWNQTHPFSKRGIAVVPTKFGLGDPRSERSAATVMVQILTDGSVLVQVAHTDAQDDLEEGIRLETAKELGIAPDSVRVILNDFDAFPTATPPVGTDAAGLIRHAIHEACRPLRDRLREVSLDLFAARGQTGISSENLNFRDGVIGQEISPSSPIHFREVVETAWAKRIPLISIGYHRTPNLWWDHELGAGWPFSSFTYGAAMAEVQIDTFTGEVQILHVDLVCEGSSFPQSGSRDLAQASRAFLLGVGWLLSEEIPYPESDLPLSTRPSEPLVDLTPSSFADAPFEFRVERLAPLSAAEALPGQPCAEAPLLLSFAVREAILDALRAFGMTADHDIELPFPSTPPAVLTTLREISRRLYPVPT